MPQQAARYQPKENEEFAREYELAQAQARFAVELALAREQRGLTQEQVAQAAQIRQPMLARYERGQLPSTPTLLRLASALNAKTTFSFGQVTIRSMVARRGSSSGCVAPKSIRKSTRAKNVT